MVEEAILDVMFSLPDRKNLRKTIVNGDDTVQVTPVTPDTGIAISNRANVRMINIVGTNSSPPVNLDVLLNFPDVSADSGRSPGSQSAGTNHYSTCSTSAVASLACVFTE